MRFASPSFRGLAGLVAALSLVACDQPVDPVDPDDGGGGTVDPDDGGNSGGSTPTWSSSDQWGNWTDGTYIVYNNIWGSGAGSQTVWVNSAKDWGVRANHPASGGIKSYPNITRFVGKKISALGSCTSTFSATTPSGGSWASSFDIWDSNNAHEIMLWYNWSGSVGPIAKQYDSSGKPVADFANVTVGGSTWNVYVGSNGSNAVYSFLRTSKTNSPGTVDVLAIVKYLQGKGYFGDITLGNVQYGFEITSSAGGMDFGCKNFSVSYQ